MVRAATTSKSSSGCSRPSTYLLIMVSSLGWYLDICSESELEATIESLCPDQSLTSHPDAKPKLSVGPRPMSANIMVHTRAVAEEGCPLDWDLTLCLESEPASAALVDTGFSSITLEHHTFNTKLTILTPSPTLESPNGSLRGSSIPTCPSRPELAGSSGSQFRSLAKSSFQPATLKEHVVSSVPAIHEDPCLLYAKLSVSAESIREALSRPFNSSPYVNS